MANYTKVGTITAAGSTGDEVVTGLGFTPSAVVFIWNPTVTAEDTKVSDVYLGLGVFADDGNGIQEWSQYIFADDNGSAGVVKSAFSGTKCLSSNGNGEADAVSLDSDGFTINWSTAPANGQIVYWMAYNSAIFEASAGTMTLPAYPGSVTVSGLPFAPSALLVGAADATSAFSIGISANHGDPTSPSGTNQEAIGLGGWTYAGVQYGQEADTQGGASYDMIAWRMSSNLFGGGTPQIWNRDQWNSDGFRISANAGSWFNVTVAAGYLALRPTNDAIHRSLAMYTGHTASSPYATTGIWPLSGFLVTAAGNAGNGPYMVALGLVDDDLTQKSCFVASDSAVAPSSSFMFSDSNEAIKGGDSTAGTDTVSLSASISDWGDEELSISRSVSTTDRRWYGLLFGSIDGTDGLARFVPNIFRRW